ncbi:MAG: leucine--tRNA ligase [Bacillales bacterium]|jgi:leucyl-tRNA synthetase|nr:leucine--tRNA ligase [Bacillales bacterium]
MQFQNSIIETKWQKRWEEERVFKAVDFSDKPKWYGLVEFPYPSGIGMHVGHLRAYSSLEVISRKKRMEGYNVLFPIGFDAFGLPTENYAIKTGIHPRIVTDANIKTFISQLKSAGFSFDYDRIIDTSSEEYYKWTQWIFIQLFKHDLVYKSKTFVNYCPKCQVILSNEESQGGKCDRCDSQVEQKQKDVWFLRITKYAQRLLDGLNEVDFTARIKTEEENWIGRSEGAYIDFITTTKHEIKVFTTRADTIYGVSFLVLAPESPLLTDLLPFINNKEEIENYIQETKKKTEFERLNFNKNKTGVELKGLKVIHPLTKKEIPLFISDYVILSYGTGAVMGVPAHDQRDYDFAKKFSLPIVEVIKGGDISEKAFEDVETGILINSPLINNLDVEEAKKTIITYLENNKLGEKTVQYKMQDWAFNRQRYWGEPIPIVYCEHCGQVPLNEEDLPLVLPNVKEFLPSINGDSPLANVPEYVNCKCPKCHRPAKRETDTMPQWAGSSWYFLRYCDARNEQEFASFDKLKYWMGVDWYNGGMEHVTRHVIYSRFWNLFLNDIGVVPVAEPYKKRTAQGLILGADGEKMSKSRGNGVDPTEMINIYGADALRTYILFMGDYELPTPWDPNGVKGAKRFIDKVIRLFEIVDLSKDEYTLETLIHQTIKQVSKDIENLKFNTAISALMILTNALAELTSISKKDYQVLITLLSVFAPHICEELNEGLGNKNILANSKWPEYLEEKTIENTIEIAVQVNGKLRGTVKIKRDSKQKDIEEKAFLLPNVVTALIDKTVIKTIYIPNKILSIVIK